MLRQQEWEKEGTEENMKEKNIESEIQGLVKHIEKRENLLEEEQKEK